MASRYLRRRLEMLIALYPPADGYAVLPEQLKSRETEAATVVNAAPPG
ncbi:MAG: hypothetical protein JST11_15570 [Acidobacteria bacterium]|nr:hypothetical protein [Acidobacteriota bacterium]